MEKRLYKSRNDRMIFGVCGGIAEYFEIDPTLVRLGGALLVFSSIGLVPYIIAAIVMPEAPMTTQTSQAAKPQEKEVVVEAEEIKDDE